MYIYVYILTRNGKFYKKCICKLFITNIRIFMYIKMLKNYDVEFEIQSISIILLHILIILLIIKNINYNIIILRIIFFFKKFYIFENLLHFMKYFVYNDFMHNACEYNE